MQNKLNTKSQTILHVYPSEKGYWGGGRAPGWGAVWAPGGRDTEVRVARSWLDGEGPLPGPLTATAAGLGTTFGGKLIAKKHKNQHKTKKNTVINTDANERLARMHQASGADSWSRPQIPLTNRDNDAGIATQTVFFFFFFMESRCSDQRCYSWGGTVGGLASLVRPEPPRIRLGFPVSFKKQIVASIFNPPASVFSSRRVWFLSFFFSQRWETSPTWRCGRFQQSGQDRWFGSSRQHTDTLG